ncbi:MAG TPA: SGNH/GDSL hydrolase family protein [Cytophagaceae bacterium]|jgi:lysophospholipase L1-like esterase
MKKYLLLLSIIAAYFGSVNAQTKIACIGNSITQYSGYTDKLQSLFGYKYAVTNFGESGTTLLYRGDSPYIKVSKHITGIFNAKPNIITIKLGTNDSKSQNWDVYKKEFVGDYNKLIDTLLHNISPKPKIYLCLPCPSTGTGSSINGIKIRDEIIPLIKQVATQRNLPIIDIHTPMIDKMSMFPDGVHPNADGATEIAKIIYNALINVTPTIREENRFAEAILYPNPASQEFFLDAHTVSDYLIKDASGKTVSSGILNPGQSEPVGHLANGIYTCIIMEKGAIKEVKKLTVNR